MKARTQVSNLLGCKSQEIVFTAGGTESNNHVLKGVLFAAKNSNVHVITTQVEHPAILNPCRFLERLGAEVTYLAVDGFGRVDPDEVRRAITSHTALISVMHAITRLELFSRSLTSQELPGDTAFYSILMLHSLSAKSARAWRNLASTCCR